MESLQLKSDIIVQKDSVVDVWFFYIKVNNWHPLNPADCRTIYCLIFKFY